MEIRVYNLGDKSVGVVPTHRKSNFEPELSSFISKNWDEHHKGWTDSYVASIGNLSFAKDSLNIQAEYMRYSEIAGMVKAIEGGYSFAPDSIPGLSVGIYMVTSDDKIILPRRSSSVKHAPNMYNPFSGWMASMNIASRQKCEHSKFAHDPRLYNYYWQAIKETMEESQLLPLAEFEIEKSPASLVNGLAHSFNYMFEFMAKTHLRANNVRKRILNEQEEFAEGRKEHDIIAAVNFDHLTQLLRNQPDLHQEDPVSFEPSDDRELILLDDCIGGLVTNFENITGKKRPVDLIDFLREGGINISYLDYE